MTEQLLRPRPGSRFLGREKFGSMQALLRRLPVETYVITFTLVLWIALSLATPNFLTENNVSNMMRQTSIAAIMAIGVMFTIVIAGIDLSVGSVAAFCGVPSRRCAAWAWPWAVGPADDLGRRCGRIVNASAIARLGIPAFIVTLAGLQSYRGLALLLAGGMTVGGLPTEVKDFARGTMGLPNLFWRCWLSLSSSITSSVHSNRTLSLRHGLQRRGRAPSGNTHLPHHAIAYVVSSGFAALGGILLVSRLSVASPSMANAYELQAIAAAVVGGASLFGGRGTVLGAVVGAVLFTTMSNGAVLLDIDPFWEMVLEGLLIALVVYLDNLQKKRQCGA